MSGADGARGAADPGAGPDPRAALRAFVRTHHPDVGGDPEAFRAGLAAHRAALGDGRAGPDRPVLAADDPRLDVPIVVVRGGPIHRIGRLGRRLARRVDPRPGTPRVL